MSVLLYVVGGVAVLSGLLSIGFGIPVKEFSFGDTLIIAGTVATIGGFVIIALAAATTQLTRIAEMLGDRPLSRSGAGAGTVLGRSPIPFPPKTKAREEMPPPPPPAVLEPAPSFLEPIKDERPLDAAPSLPNPDMPVMAEAEAEELPLSPAKPPMPPRPAVKFPEPPKAPAAEMPPPSFEPPWRKATPRPSPSSYFDAMLKDDKRAEPTRSPESLSRAESIPRAPAMAEPEPKEAEPAMAQPEESRAVAILKSGVVDGMGYTLYVDGSIEAELPDGTVRFASINELRAHLERDG